MKIDEAKKLIKDAFKEQGRTLSHELEQLAFTPVDRATWSEHQIRIVEITNMVQRKFWQVVQAGECIGDPDKVALKYGKSVEENYNLAGGPFIDLARAYWTYKAEVKELMEEHNDLLVSHALQALEINLRQLFFPTPGPLVAPERLRREAQTRYLGEFAPSFNIDRFIAENPILKVDKKTGCLGAVFVFCVFGAALGASLFI